MKNGEKADNYLIKIFYYFSYHNNFIFNIFKRKNILYLVFHNALSFRMNIVALNRVCSACVQDMRKSRRISKIKELKN
jgi:hypothetical protein